MKAMVVIVGLPSDSTLCISVPKNVSQANLKALLEKAGEVILSQTGESDENFPATIRFDADDIKQITSKSSVIDRLKSLISTLGGNPSVPGWSSNFFIGYNQGSEEVGELIKILKDVESKEIIDYLNSYNLGWLIAFANAKPYYNH